jgi:hypothetical protein
LGKRLTGRTVYEDIWSSHQNSYKIYNTSRFLLSNVSTDTGFIDKVHPDYVFVRYYWYSIENGILFPTAGIKYSQNYPLYDTNYNKLLFKCNQECNFGNATLVKVFGNNDDIIYKVYYNK